LNQWFFVFVNAKFLKYYIDPFAVHCKHILMVLLIFNWRFKFVMYNGLK